MLSNPTKALFLLATSHVATRAVANAKLLRGNEDGIGEIDWMDGFNGFKGVSANFLEDVAVINTSSSTSSSHRNLQTTCCSSYTVGYSRCTDGSTGTTYPDDRPECADEKTCTGGRCKMQWLTVPITRDGCCSFDGSDCSGVDPSTNEACQYIQTDCEDCGGVWRPLSSPGEPTGNPTPSPTPSPTPPLPPTNVELRYICHKNLKTSDEICASGAIVAPGTTCQAQDDPCGGPKVCWVEECVAPTKSPTAAPTPAPTPSPTASRAPSEVPSSSPLCPPIDTSSPTGPPNTISYKPGENTATSNEGYLRLSTGLLAEIIADTGSPVELKGIAPGVFSSDTFHSLPDGATVISKEELGECGGGWYYVSNSESSTNGGVGAIEFNAAGEVFGYRRILSDTSRNCGGGKMWWGTWVTCEEVSGGKVYEVHPENADPTVKRQTLLGVSGRNGGNYESVAYDRRPAALHPQDGRPRFFLTEDTSNGPLERFRPSQAVWDAAQQSGDYSDLLHVNSGNTAVTDYVLITPQSSGAKVGTFVWTSNIGDARTNAQNYYPNCEGIDIRDGMLYMTCKARKQLFIFDLDALTYVESSTVSGAFAGQPDQIASLVGSGDNAGENIVYFCEDVGDSAGVHGRDSTGEYYTIAQDEGGVLSAETTGLAFSPDRKYMYVSYQMGYIYKIWREDGRAFGGTTLDIKYHSDGSGPIFSL